MERQNLNHAAKVIAPLALLALVGALWAGLLRLGWRLPTPQGSLAAAHGPLMVAGFFSVVIGLERAVALKWPFAYLAPLLAGMAGLLLLFDGASAMVPLLATLGSLVLVIVFGRIVRDHPAAYTVTMAVATVAGLVGNLLWLAGRPLFEVVFWWASFLVLTIAGERLELGRLLNLSRPVQVAFGLIVALVLAGAALASFNFDAGTRLYGLAALLLAAWLLRYDIARRTVRKQGLTRFIAVCMLSGYGWLAISGLIGLVYGGIPAGPVYDAMLHALFVGFVFAMVFGHAPIIIPALTGLRISYAPVFYLHLVLLHGSLLLRLLGDLAGWVPLRQWGGMLNVVALLLFAGVTITFGRTRNDERKTMNAARGN
ncbi:MAG: hypothetical protein MUD01_25225 [Chloroflexaceae bacterium]|jgi:hypothetical protein|nr:hypothetical protein [Chloroflexaceae bacterium]